MLITVTNVSPAETKSRGKNTWQEVTVNYKAGGKDMSYKLMSFSPLFKRVREIQVGQNLEVKLEKDAKNYWQWTDFSVSGSGAPATGATSGKASFESKEERDLRQLYIMRQSSLAQAVAYHEQNSVTAEEVCETADIFLKWVMTGSTEKDLFAGLEDDLPE
jgi:hypothetical protein